MFETLPEFLTWVGSGVGALVIFSFVAELFPGWAALEAKTKAIIAKIAVASLAIAAYVILNYVPVEFLLAIDPYFKIIAGVLFMDFSVSLYHDYTKKG